jgi:hypothetical protein
MKQEARALRGLLVYALLCSIESINCKRPLTPPFLLSLSSAAFGVFTREFEDVRSTEARYVGEADACLGA